MFNNSKNVQKLIRRDRNNIDLEAKHQNDVVASVKSDRTIPEIWKSVEIRLQFFSFDWLRTIAGLLPLANGFVYHRTDR